MTTRGSFAYTLFDTIGFDAPTSARRFADSGGTFLDGVTSTLADLGITNGISDTEFGITQEITRGEAFTMLARSLGLADADSSIEEASEALMRAGIVRGYNNDPASLGLNDPLRDEDMGRLIERIEPELSSTIRDDGTTLRDSLHESADKARDQFRSENDPVFAAFMASSGARQGDIGDELALREELFGESSERRAEKYGRELEQSQRGVSQDFENRGFFRSGAHATGLERDRLRSQNALQDEQYQADQEYQEYRRRLEAQRRDLAREEDIGRAQSDARTAQRDAQDRDDRV